MLMIMPKVTSFLGGWREDDREGYGKTTLARKDFMDFLDSHQSGVSPESDKMHTALVFLMSPFGHKSRSYAF